VSERHSLASLGSLSNTLAETGSVSVSIQFFAPILGRKETSMENKGLQHFSISQESLSLREELDQFNMETFEIEDLTTLDQDAPIVAPTVCSSSDCIYCCSTVSL
jgi:hypothetical protein